MFDIEIQSIDPLNMQAITILSKFTGWSIPEAKKFAEGVAKGTVLPILQIQAGNVQKFITECGEVGTVARFIGESDTVDDSRSMKVEESAFNSKSKNSLFCHMCGTQIKEGSVFCHKCGTKVVYDCTRSQALETEVKGEINMWASLRKPVKIISWILVPIVILVLISSGVSKISNYVSADDTMEYDELTEDYTGDYYEQYQNLDSSLVGRWRSYDGGTLEFSDSGVITSCDFQCWSLVGRKPDLIYWEASNGRVTCSAYFNSDIKYWIFKQFEGEKDEREIISIGGGDSDYYRVSGTYGGGIVGKWVSVYGEVWSYQFNEDGTGMWNGKFPITWCTYTTDDGASVLNYSLLDSTYFDYTVTGDVLTVFLSDGSRIYTKVGR